MRRVIGHPLVWLALVLAALLGLAMAFAYIGGFTDPVGSLRGLPIAVVNADQPQTVAGRRVDVGRRFVAALRAARTNAEQPVRFVDYPSEAAARRALGDDRIIGAVLLPADLSRSVARIGTSLGDAPPGRVTLLRNVAAGSLQPAVFDAATRRAVDELAASVRDQLASVLASVGARLEPSSVASLARPVVATTVDVPPLGNRAGRALPPFYLAVVSTLTGLLGMTALHTTFGALAGRDHLEALGRSLPVRRVELSVRQRFAAEAVLAVPMAGLAGGAVAWMAVGVVGTEAQRPWLVAVFAMAAVLAIAWVALAFLTAFGILGDLVAILATTIFGVPSARGVYPEQAMPAFFRGLGAVLPLRWITDGMRAAFYFDGRATAGLAGGWAALVMYGIGGLAVGWLVTLVVERNEARAVRAAATGPAAAAS
ncbi:MAG: DUF3533 domain-containing protein [Actinobacteria bacterium]|nr:DUF3533 domain-containing protein [Actinomycetota bacterium]